MEVQGGVLDVAGGPAVVVDDRHAVAALQHLGGLHEVRAVGVHHDKKGPRLQPQESLLLVHKRPGVLRQLPQLRQHQLGGVVVLVDDDLGLAPPLPGDAHKARRRAQGVHVGVAVAHDVDLLGVLHQLAQGVGHDPGLDLGPLLRGLGPPAVEGEVLPRPHHGLVAAPGEGHLQGEVRPLIELRYAVRVLPHADGEGGVQALRHLHSPDGVQHRELLGGKMLKVLLLKEEEVVVPLGLDEDAHALRPLAQLLVDLGQDGAALGIRAGFHEVVVVVHLDEGHDGPGGGVLLPEAVTLRHVHPVGGGNQPLGAAALGPLQAAVDLEAAAVHLHPLRAAALPLQQPAGGKMGHGVLHLHLEKVLPDACQLQKVLVAPDDLAGVRPEDHDGQGRVDEGGLAGGVHAAGDAVDILQDLLLPGPAAADEPGVEPNGRRQLRRRQPGLEGDGQQGIEPQHREVELPVGLHEPGEFLIHRAHSLSGPLGPGGAWTDHHALGRRAAPAGGKSSLRPGMGLPPHF